MNENNYMSMTILELHALAQEIRLKLSYETNRKAVMSLNNQLQTIETSINERYLDC